MNKTSSKLDWNRLLGFEQVASERAELRYGKVASKVGGKVGGKVGVKTGSKIGVKIGSKQGVKF